MPLTDRLIKDTAKKRKLLHSLPDENDEEETMTYQKRKAGVSLNKSPDVFDSQLNRGINSDKSIFDKTAVFRPGK